VSAIAGFFKGTESRLGVFYPLHCIAAVFPTLEISERVARNLQSAGFSQSDLLAVSGRDVLEFDREEATLGRLVMRAISRFFKTEQSFADRDLEHARDGAGFLMARCPTDREKNAAWPVIKAGDPLAARYYSVGAIEHLAGDPDTD